MILFRERLRRQTGWLAGFAMIVSLQGGLPAAETSPRLPGPGPILIPPPVDLGLVSSTDDTVTPPAPEPQSVPVDDDWSILISPQPSGPGSAECATTPADRAAAYEGVYQSIPYRRSEYLANPSYRHEATMEMLFGQMRPTVIQKNDTPERIVNIPPPLYRPYLMSRGDMYTIGSWMNYGGPFLPLTPSFITP